MAKRDRRGRVIKVRMGGAETIGTPLFSPIFSAILSSVTGGSGPSPPPTPGNFSFPISLIYMGY